MLKQSGVHFVNLEKTDYTFVIAITTTLLYFITIDMQIFVGIECFMDKLSHFRLFSVNGHLKSSMSSETVNPL